MLQKLRPFIKKINLLIIARPLQPTMYVQRLDGQVTVFRRAHESSSNIELNYVLPKEGCLMSLGVFAIPGGAKNVSEAYALTDYLLRSESAERNTGITNFANGISLSRAVAYARNISQQVYLP